MRKLFFYFIVFVLLPFTAVLFASFFIENVEIGKTGKIFENCYMGKQVMVEQKGLCKGIDIEEYVLGVLIGTIPADYDEDTIMAQAVLIRTNVLKEMGEKKTEDSAKLSYHYMTLEERKELFGNVNYEKMERKFENAVYETAGQVIVWQDALIMGAYHEVSIGKTLSAKEVLGEDIPYLQSVDSSQDVESKYYMGNVEYKWEEIDEILGQGDTKTFGINIEETSENGIVKTIMVGERKYSGEEFQKRLSIPSQIYYIEEIEQGIRFVSLGKGNGMGMSLYGANYLALQGKSYKELLTYYYIGTVVKKYVDIPNHL